MMPIAHGQFGDPIRIEFAEGEGFPSAFNLVTGGEEKPALEYRLPLNYSKDKSYPLVVFLAGGPGGPAGNVNQVRNFVGDNESVVASMPLFIESANPLERENGQSVGFIDYPVMSAAYRILLTGLFDEVPNIDPEKSALVGWSNGARAIAILVSSADQYTLDHFHSFVFIDGGMFHMTEFRRKQVQRHRYLMFYADPDKENNTHPFQRKTRNDAAKIVQAHAHIYDVDFESRPMKDTTHKMTEEAKKQIKEWIFQSK